MCIHVRSLCYLSPMIEKDNSVPIEIENAVAWLPSSPASSESETCQYCPGFGWFLVARARKLSASLHGCIKPARFSLHGITHSRRPTSQKACQQGFSQKCLPELLRPLEPLRRIDASSSIVSQAKDCALMAFPAPVMTSSMCSACAQLM